MKTLRLLLAIFTLGLAFASCQKDFSFEAGNSKGTLLKTTAGDCDGINVQGIYFKDTLLRSSNYVDVQVDFSKIGTYTIKSDTVNGYSFNAVGNITALGVNTVRLVAVGKPIADGFDAFTLNYNGSTCLFNVQVLLGTGGGTGAADFTFSNCAGSTLAGTYTAGIAMTPANTVTIPVNVTTAGTYTLTTSANGVTFSSTGSLALTTTSIVLTATGTTPSSPTPISAVPFPLMWGTSNCTFNVTFAATPSAAVFMFDCMGGSVSINGTYQVTVNAAVATNYIDFPVNVTTAGSYSITATTPMGSNYGFNFSGSGLLAIGATTVRLYAAGTPLSGAANFSDFTVTTTSPASTCTANVPVTDGTISFVNGTTTNTFNFDNEADTSFNINTPLPNDYELLIGGQANASTLTDIFGISITKLTPFTTGPITINELATGVLVSVSYTNAAGVDYTAISNGTTQTPGFSLNIQTLTTTRIKGIFSGQLSNTTAGNYLISGGVFDLPLD